MEVAHMLEPGRETGSFANMLMSNALTLRPGSRIVHADGRTMVVTGSDEPKTVNAKYLALDGTGAEHGGDEVVRFEDVARVLPPQVGDGCTILHWTDRDAGTVVYVSPSGKTVRVQVDTATRADKNGMSESQAYTYEPNPSGAVHTFRLGKRGWKSSGRGSGAAFGTRAAYHDYSF
jgi:hypothetical protein